jgi:hypothetical protein
MASLSTVTNRTTVKIKKLFEHLRGELFTLAFTRQTALRPSGRMPCLF